MDGQFNLNHLLRHMHQWMHRVASKKGDRITALQNAKAKQQIDIAHVNYELGLDILKLICRNLDFANMAFNLGMKTGLKGTVHMSIKDILAQAPMKIQSVLNEDKNLGRTPLVPMLVHTTPKSNGDVIIQVYHVIKEAHIDSIAIGMNSSNSNIDVAVGMGSSSVGRNDLNSSQRSTNSIQDMSAPISISASNNQQSLRRSSGSVNNSVIAHKSSLSVQTTSASSHASEGRTQIQKDKMHSFAHVVATSPHLSLIVDNNVSLKAGSELFTVAVGPRDPTWKPFGADEATDKKFDSVPVKSRFDSKSPSPERPAKIPIGTMGGCPILMQTGNGIRFLAQVPNAQVRVSLPDLIRFLQAHLVDIPKLKQFLETSKLLLQLLVFV